MAEDELAPVWKALADPTRRRILDLLSLSPMTTGQLAAFFPSSRIAVMKHLGVLGEAGLVLRRKRGRERWHYLNFVPLQRLHERWFERHAERWAASFTRLKRHLDGGDLAMTDEATIDKGARSWPLSLDIEQEIAFEAPPERVFSALTEEIGAWWGAPYLHEQATALELEPRLGGWLRERWGPGAGALLATVTAIVVGERLELTGRLHMGVVQGVVTFVLRPEGGGTRLNFSHQAIGHLRPEVAARAEGGWAELLGVRLKTFVERGERLGIAGSAPQAKT